MKKILCMMLVLAALVCTCACETNELESTDFSSFTYRGMVVFLDMDADVALADLGEYLSFAETNSCYGDGKDKVYQYTSFKLMTYSSQDKDYVLSVEIFNDTDEEVSTAEGIRIGAKAEEVIARYGETGTQTDSSIVYVNAQTKTRLQFLLRDGVVTNIQYLKSE